MQRHKCWMGKKNLSTHAYLKIMWHRSFNTLSTYLSSNICCRCVLLLARGLGEWLFHTIIRAITTRCVCLCVSVHWKVRVCFLLWRGGAGRTNMSFWVGGCRANIDPHAWRHAAGQIKHSCHSGRAQRTNDTSYHLDELASVCQTDHRHHHTVKEGGRHTGDHKLHIHTCCRCAKWRCGCAACVVF